ncbi:MAG: glycosyltransferase family 2 protein [Thermoleophilaceae bacterium]|nr:glycosyltransferase family 2 protein [Thermoleophilaceae bacterium]
MSPISPAHPELRVSVVVPARDEEELVADCIGALARQEGVSPAEFEVLLVLDRCRDATRERALAVGRAHPRMRLHLLEGPGLGAGHARRTGMDAAASRLAEIGETGGLVASTDADTVTDRDWIRAQIDLVRSGARAIGGRIEILPGDRAALPPAALEARERSVRLRHLRALADAPHGADHGHFSGASMSLTAADYARVGGLEPKVALEDEALERALGRHGVPIIRSDSVRVHTSGRTRGRAPRGLAHDLAEAVRRSRPPG